MSRPSGCSVSTSTRFRRRITALGGRLGRAAPFGLDYTPESLDELGEWFHTRDLVAADLTPKRTTWRIGDGQHVPLLAQHANADPPVDLPIEALWLVHELAAYVGETIRRWTGTDWVIVDEPRGSSYIGARQPALMVHGRDVHPFAAMTSRVRSRLRLLEAGKRPTGVQDFHFGDFTSQPDRPAGVDQALPLDEELEIALDDPGLVEDGYAFTVWLDEGLEHAIGRERFDAIESELLSVSGIRRAMHEDREILHVDTDLAEDELLELVRQVAGLADGKST